MPQPRAVTPEVSSLIWNRCPGWCGTNVQFASEQVFNWRGIRKGHECSVFYPTNRLHRWALQVSTLELACDAVAESCARSFNVETGGLWRARAGAGSFNVETDGLEGSGWVRSFNVKTGAVYEGGGPLL
jgi:hypothetical protein